MEINSSYHSVNLTISTDIVLKKSEITDVAVSFMAKRLNVHM